MLAPVSSCTPFSVDGVPTFISHKYHKMQGSQDLQIEYIGASLFVSNAILSALMFYVVTKVSGKMTSKAAFVERFFGSKTSGK